MLKLRAALVALPLAVLGTSACTPRNNPNSAVPNGADPEKVSRNEYDVAADDWKHGRLRAALEHALKASAIDEGHAEAHHFVAVLYMALCQVEGDCRWGEAEKYARKAVSADAEFRPARHTLGVILIHEKKFDEAIAVLRPLAEDILYKTPELAWYDLGGAYIEKGEADQAVEALQKAIALKPTFCWANFRLGLALEKKGLWEKAEDELSRAVEPEEPQCKNLQDAYEARARVRAKVGKKDLAKQDLQQCSSLSPSTPAGRSCTAAHKTM
jgi:Tfp pilus assembly protein PilF